MLALVRAPNYRQENSTPPPGARQTVVLSVKVKPRASKSRVIAMREGVLEVAIAAPPVDGEANAELLRTLSGQLKIAKSQIQLVAGASSRLKRVTVTGLSADELALRLGVHDSRVKEG